MSDSAPREALKGMCRWFRIHLSTAVLLNFAAGGIIWLNVGALPKGNVSSASRSYGWPFAVNPQPAYKIQPFRWSHVSHVARWIPSNSHLARTTSSTTTEIRDCLVLSLEDSDDADYLVAIYDGERQTTMRRIQWRYFFSNLAVGIVMLMSLAIVCEFVMFKRAGSSA